MRELRSQFCRHRKKIDSFLTFFKFFFHADYCKRTVTTNSDFLLKNKTERKIFNSPRLLFALTKRRLNQKLHLDFYATDKRLYKINEIELNAAILFKRD